MGIPLFIILILYLLLAACFVLFSLFLVYHALRFGVATISNVLVMIIYIVVSAVILVSAYSFIVSVDWMQTIQIL
ncbi:hypothetical protein GYA54_01595 [Candidatus Kuenenbacteria bacterium]|nr:hypothetical protein [Candidatus Kuenenbacteria bacterium]